MQIVALLIPIFSLIFLGYLLKRFLSPEFWQGLNKAVYFIFTPALVVYNLANFEFAFKTNLISLLVIFFSMGVMFVFAYLSCKVRGLAKADFPVLVQSFIRFNTFIFLAVIQAFGNQEQFGLSVLLVSFSIPIVNVICVMSFASFTLKNLILQLLKNPLVVSSVVGIFLSGFEITLFPPVMKLLALLAQPTLVLGVLCVGAGLYIKDVWSRKYFLLFLSLGKLVIYPLMVYAVASLFALPQEAVFVLVIFAGNSTAVASYVLTKELKGDHPLMASAITAQVVLSALSLTVILHLFGP